MYSAKDVNTAWSFLKQALSTITDKHAPKIQKRVKGRSCPWLSHDIKTTMNSRDKLLRKARKTNCENDWSSYKRLKNLCNNKTKQAKQKYYNDLLTENRRNPTKFWRCIKEIFPSKAKPTSSSTSNDNTKNTSNANSFCSFFTNVASTLKAKAFPLQNFVWEKPQPPTTATQTFKFEHVSRIFVEKELKSLKRKKAAGWDDLPPGIVKDGASALSGPLAFLINLSLKSGMVLNE